MYFINNSC